MIITSIQINALADLIEQAAGIKNNDIPTPEEQATYLLEHGVIPIPCKIGDKVWTIRRYNGINKAREGVVSEMYFDDAMRLAIVVKGLARGVWGKKVFATREECERAIKEEKKNDYI